MEGALTLKMRQYVTQCVGILEGYIDACYEVAPMLKSAWLEHDAQRRISEDLRGKLRDCTNAEDIAYSAASSATDVDGQPVSQPELLNQIRTTSQKTIIVETRFNIATSLTLNCKRALEDYQRVLNDMHIEIKKLIADIRQLGTKYSYDIEAFAKMTETCILTTSPLQIISSIS